MRTYRRAAVLAASLWLLMFTAAGSVAAANSSGTTPEAGFDLARLKGLESSQLTSRQKASLGLRLFRDEMTLPTPGPRPPFTAFKTHDYVLARITRKLAETGADVAVIRKEWETASPGEVKDCLAIFLLLKGEKSAKDPVQTYILERGHPMRLRELAVEAIGEYSVREDDPGTGGMLAHLVREDLQTAYKLVPGEKPGAPSQMLLVYPVKRAAVEAIQRMERAGMLLESPVTMAAKNARLEIALPRR